MCIRDSFNRIMADSLLLAGRISDGIITQIDGKWNELMGYDSELLIGKRYDREDLMNEKYDETDLAKLADDKIRTFQADASKEAGIFHHLITLPTYHTAALSTDNLAKEYFGTEGMLGYVANVQRKEIRQGIACVKHQNMSGSDMGDDHKEYFAGDAALKAAGEDNTMNQF